MILRDSREDGFGTGDGRHEADMNWVRQATGRSKLGWGFMKG